MPRNQRGELLQETNGVGILGAVPAVASRRRMRICCSVRRIPPSRSVLSGPPSTVAPRSPSSPFSPACPQKSSVADRRWWIGDRFARSRARLGQGKISSLLHTSLTPMNKARPIARFDNRHPTTLSRSRGMVTSRDLAPN